MRPLCEREGIKFFCFSLRSLVSITNIFKTLETESCTCRQEAHLLSETHNVVFNLQCRGTTLKGVLCNRPEARPHAADHHDKYASTLGVASSHIESAHQRKFGPCSHCGIHPTGDNTHATCHFPNQQCAMPGCLFVVSSNSKYVQHIKNSHVKAYKVLSIVLQKLLWEDRVDAYLEEIGDHEARDDLSCGGESESDVGQCKEIAKRVSARAIAAKGDGNEVVIPFRLWQNQYDRNEMETLAINTACNLFSIDRIFTYETWSVNVYYRAEALRPNNLTPEAIVAEVDDRLDRFLIQGLKLPELHVRFYLQKDVRFRGRKVCTKRLVPFLLERLGGFIGLCRLYTF